MALNYVRKIEDKVEINNVIVSAMDKDGLDVLVDGLLRANDLVKFYATGNSFVHIEKLLGKEARRRLVAISAYTGQPEMQGGLVKTLDYKIYLGLLSEKYNAAHQEDLKKNCAVTFDMVVCNLYPFRETVAQKNVTPESARTNIDIGGPCMIRAGAKNYHRVAVVCDKNDYDPLVKALVNSRGCLDIETRFTLARKAFSYIAEYDDAIAEYMINTGTEEIKRCYTFA